jgi:hypothetical protein
VLVGLLVQLKQVAFRLYYRFYRAWLIIAKSQAEKCIDDSRREFKVEVFEVMVFLTPWASDLVHPFPPTSGLLARLHFFL